MRLTTLKWMLLSAIALYAGTQPVFADAIPVANHSFEYPKISLAEIGQLPAIPFASGWTEEDVDPEGTSTNTGIFANVPAGYPGHIPNASGDQLGFIGSQQGNALWQFLPAVYEVGKRYRLTVAVCPSSAYPPPAGSSLELSFIYLSYWQTAVFITSTVLIGDVTPDRLIDFSLTTPVVKSDDPWVGKSVGIAMRAVGAAGGYWDVDNVRVTEFPLIPNFDSNALVNLNDFSQMAAEWQSCSNTETDVTGDGCVNLEDLSILAEHWLSDGTQS